VEDPCRRRHSGSGNKAGWFRSSQSPDGKTIFYSKGCDRAGIWQVPAAGGVETPIPELREAGYYRYWAVVDSGIYLVPQTSKPSATIDYFSLTNGQLSRIITLGKQPLYGPSGLSVSSDGKWILYAEEDQVVSDIMLVEGFK
jgi:hypothetical protein